MKKFKLFFCILLSLIVFNNLKSAEQTDPIKVDWSFKGLLGKFDRASLQRGYQVYNEVCASCHSMQYLSYRNLGEPGGPEFSEEEVKDELRFCYPTSKAYFQSICDDKRIYLVTYVRIRKKVIRKSLLLNNL